MKYFIIFSIFIYSTVQAQNIVLNENFQTGIPTSWTIINNDGFEVNSDVSEYTAAWIPKVDPENSSDTVASSTSYFSNPGEANRWLITPAINLGAYGNFISWEAKSHDPSYTEDYKVLISTSNDISSFQDTVDLIFEENFLWQNHEVDLSDLGYNNQTVYIAFVLNTYDGFKFYLDDVIVRSEDPVSVFEIAENGFSISPNPCNNLLNISTVFEIDNIEIVNQLGETVLSSTKNDIDVSGLNDGIYFVNVKNQTSLLTQKLIVKH